MAIGKYTQFGDASMCGSMLAWNTLCFPGRN